MILWPEIWVGPSGLTLLLLKALARAPGGIQLGLVWQVHNAFTHMPGALAGTTGRLDSAGSLSLFIWAQRPQSPSKGC